LGNRILGVINSCEICAEFVRESRKSPLFKGKVVHPSGVEPETC
jgi:hypothetical protein